MLVNRTIPVIPPAIPPMHTRAAFAIFTAPMLLIAQPSAAQTPRAMTFGKPAAELHETFTSISSLREMSDGRVIIADNRDNLLQLADLKAQTLTKIGRNGAGPGEYRHAGRLHPQTNDTTLMEDFVNNRLLVINPDGKAGATRVENLGAYQSAAAFGFDDHGAKYLTVRVVPSKEGRGPSMVLRYDPQSKHVDTITTIVRPNGLVSGAGALGNGMLKYFTNLPFVTEDLFAITHDGRVAVARSQNYHVEWFARDGKKIVGPVVKYTPVEINAAEKRAFLEKQVRPGNITVRSTGGSAVPRSQSGTSTAIFAAGTYDDEGMTWPAHKPPFVANAVAIDGGGRLWVLRTTPLTAPGLSYDVFDAAAKLVLTVTLPPHTKVVGFGAKSVYLSFSDEDDLLHLQRYAAPQ